MKPQGGKSPPPLKKPTSHASSKVLVVSDVKTMQPLELCLHRNSLLTEDDDRAVARNIVAADIPVENATERGVAHVAATESGRHVTRTNLRRTGTGPRGTTRGDLPETAMEREKKKMVTQKVQT